MPEKPIFTDKMLVRTAKVVSALFTPYLIPLVMFLALFFFSYLRIIPFAYKMIVLGVVYGFTILMPMLTVSVLRKLYGFSPEDPTQRYRRYVPFGLTIVSYLLCLLIMRRLNIPWYMSGIVLSILLTMLVCMLFNLRWKLSGHMAGMGAIVGGLAAFSALFGYNPVGWLCLFILAAGILGTARIVVGQHTLGEVLGGFAVGIACTLLVLHPASILRFRMLLF